MRRQPLKQQSSPGQIPLLEPRLAVGKTKGHPLSWETRQKISQSHEGKPMKGRAYAGRKNHLAKGFRFYDPDGNLHIGQNVKHFCRQHGLYYRAMLDVKHGRTKHHRGWTSTPSRKRPKGWAANKPFCFISPTGEVHQGVNIEAFAKRMGLTPQLLCLVDRGIRNHHKGWTRGELPTASVETEESL